MENASREYSYDKVKAMINRQQEEYSWEFLFIGANIDAVATAGRIGISEDRAANYRADAKGTKAMYEAVAHLACRARADQPITGEWKKDLEDYARRS
jgi:hypothetical protein